MRERKRSNMKGKKISGQIKFRSKERKSVKNK